MNRASGILLHITSLSGGEGIGDLGSAARAFVDWLVAAGQSWWQVLPCGEVGFGASPYQSPSAYAGNPLLISLDQLLEIQLLDEGDLQAQPMNSNAVDFQLVKEFKNRVLKKVCSEFTQRASASLMQNYQEFVSGTEQHWLHDYARFTVLKNRFDGSAWNRWPKEFAQADSAALRDFDKEEAPSLEAVKIVQFLFYQQWTALRLYANSRGISLLGDCPIYVASDSVDVWSHPELFDLDAGGSPKNVAGVPPDYFAPTGQLWGNPLYLWEKAAEDNYLWWRARMKHCATQFDLTRIDHFRGLESYWSVPASAPDASFGAWQVGPGSDFLHALQQDFQNLPLVAEDLGDITDAVHELRQDFRLPGMRVLQFGFDGGSDNPHAPENITADAVCYAGTHDNNTTLGWLEGLPSEIVESLKSRYFSSTLQELVDAIVDVVLSSPAQLAVITVQDLLRLSEEARFNTPGTVGDNWLWRLEACDLTTELAQKLKQRCRSSGRTAESSEDSRTYQNKKWNC